MQIIDVKAAVKDNSWEAPSTLTPDGEAAVPLTPSGPQPNLSTTYTAPPQPPPPQVAKGYPREEEVEVLYVVPGSCREERQRENQG